MNVERRGLSLLSLCRLQPQLLEPPMTKGNIPAGISAVPGDLLHHWCRNRDIHDAWFYRTSSCSDAECIVFLGFSSKFP